MSIGPGARACRTPKLLLALDALFMANAREQQLCGTVVEQTRVALDTAIELVRE